MLSETISKIGPVMRVERVILDLLGKDIQTPGQLKQKLEMYLVDNGICDNYEAFLLSYYDLLDVLLVMERKKLLVRHARKNIDAFSASDVNVPPAEPVCPVAEASYV